MFDAHISKEKLSSLPLADHPNPIVVIDTPAKEQTALTEIQEHSVVGFDTETRPSFTKGEEHQVALIQIATPVKSYLFRVHVLEFSTALKTFLTDEKIKKVGLSLRDDARAIRRRGNFTPEGLIDLQLLCPAFGILDSSLQKVYAILFEKHMSKRQQLSNWEAAHLSDAQQRYAALDALACLQIYNKLLTLPVPALQDFGLLHLD